MIEPAELKFSTTVGQDAAVGLLRRAIASERVAHAYLFAGPEGVGKTRTASAFAAALLCRSKGDEACGECVSCRKVLSGNHPDLREIHPDGAFIKIGSIREELIARVQFKPFEADWKVFIVHSAEKMNLPAANALLKTLEEPTPRTVIVLVSGAVHQILPTILSRCQKVVFGPLDVEPLARLLAQRRSLTQDQAATLARLADGSVGRGLSMDLDLAMEGRPRLGRAFFALARGKELEILELARTIVDWPEGPEAGLALVGTFLADAALAAAGVPGRLTHPDLAVDAAAFAARYSPGVLARKTRSVTYAQRLLARNANKALATEALLIDLVTPRVTGFAERLPR